MPEGSLKSFVLLLVLLSSVIYIISMKECINEPWISPADTLYGLYELMPITFFVAGMILSIAFVINLYYLKDAKLMGAIFVFLIIYLYLTPTIVYDVPRFKTVYKHNGYVDYIMRHHHINPAEERIVNGYHCWPHAWILGDYLFTLFGNDYHLFIIEIFPTLYEMMFLPMLYLMSKIMTKDNFKITWLSVWGYYVFNWINQDYYSAQFFAYIIVFAVSYILLFMKEHNYKMKLAIILFLFMLSGYHPMTPLLYIVILSLIGIIYPKKRNIVAYCILLSLISLIVWNTFIAISYYESKIADVMNNVKQTASGDVGVKQIGKARKLENTNDIYIATARRLAVALTEFPAMLYVICDSIIKLHNLLKNRYRQFFINLSYRILDKLEKLRHKEYTFTTKKGRLRIVSGVILRITNLFKNNTLREILDSIRHITLGYSQFSACLMPGYAFEGILRGILFSMPYIMPYTMKFYNTIFRYPLLMAIVLTLTIPMHMFTHYGDDYFTTPVRSDVVYYDFIYHNIIHLDTGEKITPLYRGSAYEYKYPDYFSEKYKFINFDVWYRRQFMKLDMVDYSHTVIVEMKYSGKIDLFNIAILYSDKNFNKVYSNDADNAIYIRPRSDLGNKYL